MFNNFSRNQKRKVHEIMLKNTVQPERTEMRRRKEAIFM